MTRSGTTAVLMRDVAGRILDISPSGCLIECRCRLEVGTVGRLQMKFANETCADDVVVMRCDAVFGARSVYHVGTRFLPTTAPGVGSIRHAVAQYVDDPHTSGPGWVM